MGRGSLGRQWLYVKAPWLRMSPRYTCLSPLSAPPRHHPTSPSPWKHRHFNAFAQRPVRRSDGRECGADVCVKAPPLGFGVFWLKRAGKTRKQTGMTSLGSPGVSSQSVSGLQGRANPETDWNDAPGEPRRVIPVRFGFFSGRKGPGKPGSGL